MAKIALTGGKIIKVAEKIGLYPGCCCGGPCCQYSLTENYTVSYSGPEGNKTASGVGPFVMSDDNSMFVLFNCTSAYDCGSTFLGNKLVVQITINGTTQYDGYVEAQQPGGESPNGGVPCDQQQSMDGLSFNLINCLTLNNATLTVVVNN